MKVIEAIIWIFIILFSVYLVYRGFFQLLVFFLVIVYLIKNRNKLKKWTVFLLVILGKIILCFLAFAGIGFIVYAAMEKINMDGVVLTTGLFIQEIVSLNLPAVISGLMTFAVTGIVVILILFPIGYGIFATAK